MNWQTLSPESAAKALGTTPAGLAEDEAAARLDRYGPNVLRATPPASAWSILLGQLKSVVVLLLAAAMLVSATARELTDAVVIAAVLVLNVILGFTMELRGRRAMESLRSLDVPEATVVRGGRPRAIDAREVVPGDVIQLDAGQSVPADARLLFSTELRTVEATLTGESLPVDKRADVVLPSATTLADRSNMVFKATTVAGGSARAVVVDTGMQTEIGRIGALVAAIANQPTSLERQLDSLGRRLAVASVTVGALVAALALLRHASVAQVLETGIAVAVAAVPEGLPAVVTIAMAIGIRRMAKRHALIRRLPAVESLGSATVICTDKTGTLTAGEQTVTTMWVDDEEIGVTGVGFDPTGEFVRARRPTRAATLPLVEAALRVGALCNRGLLTRTDSAWQPHGDPTEVALLVAVRKAALDLDQLRREWPEIGELPFSSDRMLMATYHRAKGEAIVAMLKGAPTRVLDRCSRLAGATGDRPLDPPSRAMVEERNAALASRGLRVIAVASGEVAGTDERGLRDLSFVGLFGMTDPAAPGVADTIRQLRDAGVRTVMLTGDQRGTALAVARELDLLQPGLGVIEGTAVDGFSEAELAQRTRGVVAFSRVSAEAKLRIVSALQQNGEIVAMLGDGVNDAAALKKADIGVAMGRRGTDVAKDAAGVILTDDRFQTVAAAVEEGRVVFDNVRKFVFYLFSCNLAEVATLIVAGLFALPAPLSALQILWLNLVTDSFPALALAIEPPETDVMRRPPRDPRSALFSLPLLRLALFYAALIAASTLAAFVWTLRRGPSGPQHAPSVAFMTLTFTQLLHLGNARSVRHVTSPRRAVSNAWALGALVLGAILQIAAASIAPLASVLGVAPLTSGDWVVIAGFSLVPAVVGQGYKLLRREDRGWGTREGR